MNKFLIPAFIIIGLTASPLYAAEQTTHSSENEQPSTDQKKRSLSDICMVLVSDGQCTYIPKGAVLYAPEHLKSKIGTQLTGTFVSWEEFSRNNSGWIYLHQVSRTQAAGEDHLKPEAIDAYKTINRMVIAHHYGNIISVREKALKPPSQLSYK